MCFQSFIAIGDLTIADVPLYELATLSLVRATHFKSKLVVVAFAFLLIEIMCIIKYVRTVYQRM